MISCILGAAVFWGLSVFNYRLGKSPAYPPLVFTAWWTFLFILLGASSDRFHPISLESVGIFGLGGVLFTAGGLVAIARTAKIPRSPAGLSRKLSRTLHSPRRLHLTLTITLITLAALLPLFYAYSKEFAKRLGPGGDSWWARRGAGVASSYRIMTIGSFSLQDAFFGNLIVVAWALALIAYLESEERLFGRVRAYLYLAVATIYGSLTASSGIMLLFVQVAAVAIITGRRMKWQTVGSAAAVALSIFGAIAILVAKVSVRGRYGSGLTGRLLDIADLVRAYLVGSLVAFDRAPLQSASYPPWNMWMPLYIFARKLGYHVHVPPQHLHFTSIAPDSVINTYTMYYAYYPSYGVAGVVLVTFFLGVALVKVYMRALQGSRVAIAVSAVMTSGIIMSGFSEAFFMPMYQNLKILAVVYGVYTIASRGYRPRQAALAKGVRAVGRIAAPARQLEFPVVPTERVRHFGR